MGRGQSHGGAITGGLVGPNGTVQPAGNGLVLDQRSLSKDSQGRQRQFSNRALLNNINHDGRKSQISGVSGFSQGNHTATGQGPAHGHSMSNAHGVNASGSSTANGKKHKSSLRQYGVAGQGANSNGGSIVPNGMVSNGERRARMLSVGPNGLSHALVGQLAGGQNEQQQQ